MIDTQVIIPDPEDRETWRWARRVRCDLCAHHYVTETVPIGREMAYPELTSQDADSLRYEASSHGWTTTVAPDVDGNLVLFDVCPFCSNPPA